MTRTALITGGQQGIGLGIAQALHGAGWRIALMSERGGDDPAVIEALALPGAVHVTHDIAETRSWHRGG
jgi:NAD(P)-dependent dehydrogenase (short-subunit alcohol dehydrogenase family)